jgi:hypothetical protein
MNSTSVRPGPRRPSRTLWWVITTPVLQVATAMVLATVLMLIVAALDGGWGILLGFLAGLVIGPSLVLGVIVTLARRQVGGRYPVLAGLVVGVAALAVLVVLLSVVDVVALPIFAAASMGVVAWATRVGSPERP